MKNNNINNKKYEVQHKERQYKEIWAVYSEDWIRVYQAYSKEIAKEAVRNGTFGTHFSLNRMTWIKPSFLWMMYRCGWAEKENQEHVLAIDIKRSAFDDIVTNAVISTYNEDLKITKPEWKELIQKSDIRCQWDPERDVHGNPLDYRSIQLGLRGQAVYHYVNDWIVHVTDITEYVKDLNKKRKEGYDIISLLPKEARYKI